MTGIFSLWFPTLESNPTEEEIQRKAGEEVNRRWIYWKPFVTGLATISEETMHRAHPLELRVIDEVNRLREEYLEHRVIKAELVERK